MSRTHEPRFSMTELVEATGVAKRTIRSYISENLIPPASGRGRYAWYTPDHVAAITRVRDLRSRNLSIDEIRREITIVDAAASSRAQGDNWMRIPVHSDLEIHLRSGAPEQVQELARQLQATSQRWLGDDEG